MRIFSATALPPLLLCVLLTLSAGAAAGDKIVLQLKWFHGYQFAGYYAALEQGYYAEEGLDVEIRQRDPNKVPVDQVLAGEAHFGIADSSLVLNRLRGDPVVIVAVIFQNSPLVLIARADSGIESALDLAGKRIMYQQGVDDAMITAMLNEVGLSNRDFTPVKHSFHEDALLTGEADAMSAYISNQPWYYKSRNIPINIINPVNYGVDFYGDNIFTSENFLHQHPEQVEAFRRASIRGWYYALEHSDQVYAWLKNKYVGKKYDSPQQYVYEVEQIRRMIKPRLVDIGTINPSRFNRIADMYRERALAPINSSIDGLYYLDHQEAERNWALPAILALILMCAGLLGLWLQNRKLKLKLASNCQQLAESNRAKSVFLANMSYDLRTPLNSIVGFSERLLKSRSAELDEKSLEALRTICRSSRDLMALISDILDLSRIDAGDVQLNFETCHLGELIDECVYEVMNEVEHKKLNLTRPKQLPITVIDADPQRLKQMLDNLLENAVKYTTVGGITIKVDSETVREREFVVLSVEDTGIGIRLEDQKRLFKRFEHIGTDQHNSVYGSSSTGLGLALVSEFAHLHGGYVTFESTFGEGSKFQLHLPVRQPAGNPPEK